MCDLSREFSEFYHRIALSVSQLKMVRNLRQALRTGIRQYFQTRLKLRPPIFHNRGRLATETSVAPLYAEIILEDGVLLQHLGQDDIRAWPRPEIMHLLLINAVHGHAPDPPLDKKHSICVPYAGIYRLEISVLAPSRKGCRLAVNGAQEWQIDDQERLAAWFKNQLRHQGRQLQRVACYLNAWADFHPNQLENFAWRLPLDILAARNFQADVGRDDLALSRTASAIARAVPWDEPRPDPVKTEDVLPWSLSPQQHHAFVRSIETLAEKSAQAIATRDREHACAIWRSQLGGRFPMAGTNFRWLDGGFRGKR